MRCAVGVQRCSGVVKVKGRISNSTAEIARRVSALTGLEGVARRTELTGSVELLKPGVTELTERQRQVIDFLNSFVDDVCSFSIPRAPYGGKILHRCKLSISDSGQLEMEQFFADDVGEDVTYFDAWLKDLNPDEILTSNTLVSDIGTCYSIAPIAKSASLIATSPTQSNLSGPSFPLAPYRPRITRGSPVPFARQLLCTAGKPVHFDKRA